MSRDVNRWEIVAFESEAALARLVMAGPNSYADEDWSPRRGGGPPARDTLVVSREMWPAGTPALLFLAGEFDEGVEFGEGGAGVDGLLGQGQAFLDGLGAAGGDQGRGGVEQDDVASG